MWALLLEVLGNLLAKDVSFLDPMDYVTLIILIFSRYPVKLTFSATEEVEVAVGER